jgi:UDP-N-acetylmuramoyl-L-alanyl-D-glutamate--2,6-diaminopimelate ligase
MDKILNKIKILLPKKIYKSIAPIYHFGLGFLSNLYYKNPSEKMIVIGVTGTTGKTTSVYLIAKMLRELGYVVGYTSTAMFSDGKKDWLNNKKMTMPGRFFVQSMLSKMFKNGCHYALVETTSEGIVQYRHRFINYDLLVFTGIYPEHIESHGGFENYKEAKGMLFAHLKDCKTKYVDSDKRVKKVETGLKKIALNRVKKSFIINGDDDHSNYFSGFWAEEKIIYSSSADKINSLEKDSIGLLIKNIEITNSGTNFIIDDQKIKLSLLGGFNFSNAANAFGVALSQGLDKEKISEALKKIDGIPGRLEKIDEGQKFIVIVDYAFEPRAVEKLYETIFLIPHQRIIHVLGSAGGGRDIARRPILGKIAGEKADFVIITDEDPYDDNPQIIIDQISIGAEKSGKIENTDLFKFLDRRKAIEKAFNLAEDNDIVLITGKGSEQAICLAKGEKMFWDDRVVAREELLKVINK